MFCLLLEPCAWGVATLGDRASWQQTVIQARSMYPSSDDFQSQLKLLNQTEVSFPDLLQCALNFVPEEARASRIKKAADSLSGDIESCVMLIGPSSALLPEDSETTARLLDSIMVHVNDTDIWGLGVYAFLQQPLASKLMRHPSSKASVFREFFFSLPN